MAYVLQDEKARDTINHEKLLKMLDRGIDDMEADMPDNLSILKCALDVYCSSETCEKAGGYSRNRQEKIKLGNTQAIIFNVNSIEIIE